jgi:hypothetical protein
MDRSLGTVAAPEPVRRDRSAGTAAEDHDPLHAASLPPSSSGQGGIGPSRA